MAKPVQTSSIGLKTFDKELNKDVEGFHLPANSWSHARNATNNSKTGDIGKLGNEPSNWQCGIDPKTGKSIIPYMIMGIIHITQDMWLVYSTDETDSEIGIFDESDCSYFTLINDPCLNFSKHNLIIGVCRATSTCTYRAYWDDKRRNVSRTMEFSIDPLEANLWTNPNSPLPWIQTTGPKPCYDQENTLNIDCDKLRLEPYIRVPCVHISKSITGGTLYNGSYLVSIAYAIEGQRISDWYTSNVQALFEHNDSAGSIDVAIEGLDTTFDEMYVAITSIVNQQVVTREAGLYSTHQETLSFDLIDQEWPVVPIEELRIITPVMERSDAMFNVGNFLLRSGPTSREDFNYQPLANQIETLWQAVEYPADYYVKSGNNVGHMRDEVYPFFIRWVYDTGDKTNSYHIPGRPPKSLEAFGDGTPKPPSAGQNYLVNDDGDPYDTYYFEQHNTAWQTSSPNIPTDDGGVIVGEGYMGYWESSEIYPTDKPEIWNGANNPLGSHFEGTTPYGFAISNTVALDLCGRKIRHHKFPENCTGKNTGYVGPGGGIVIMGVRFRNIKFPRTLEGDPVPGIVGWEILRGSRNGNKTVLAKGIINNMHEYDIPGKQKVKGLIPNYPYNDLHADKFLATKKYYHNKLPQAYQHWNNFRDDMFTFHSPETNFSNPYLDAKEMKIYAEAQGNVTGRFNISEKHPKGKLLTNTAFWIAAIVGVGAGILAQQGQKRRRYETSSRIESAAQVFGNTVSPSPFSTLAYGGIYAGLEIAREVLEDLFAAQSLTMGVSGGVQGTLTDTSYLSYRAGELGSIFSGTFNPGNNGYEIDDNEWRRAPYFARVVNSLAVFFSYFTEGADTMFELIRSVIQYRDFALRYHSHCLYDDYQCTRYTEENVRRLITRQGYIGPQITNFGTDHKINNLFRIRTVALELQEEIDRPELKEITRIRMVDPLILKYNDPTAASFNQDTPYNFTTFVTGPGVPQRAASFYVGLKVRMRNQYSQINGIKQLPASYCWYDAPRPDGTTNSPRTRPIFGGDIYLNRYTEKNTFFFFYDWLYDQPDGAEFDYYKYRMVPYPIYWANFEKYQMNDFTSSLFDENSLLQSSIDSTVTGTTITPSKFYNLEYDILGASGDLKNKWRLSMRNAWFYLFCSGVRDFYCESEINTAFRDWGEDERQQFYNPYGGTTDTQDLFRTDLIKLGNYYKYDNTLSYGRIFMNYVSWGVSQAVTYNPYDASTCFTYYPKRLIYSLPIQDNMIKDAWSIFLPNNFKDFMSVITCVKPVSKSGSIIFFNNLSPVMFQGIDQLQTTSGTKLTIGDGGLFNQPMQNVVNADKSYEYGACQDRLSVINTPIGIFWVNQNQGKIYNYTGSINEISGSDLRWWFSNYLPYKLTEDFPTFKVIDNPVSGIGCQAIYDNENGLVYFCKKDYKLRTDLPEDVKISYDHIDLESGETIPGEGTTFWLNDMTPFELGDETSDRYFEDASWTISYDPKMKSWISWHDWHPNLLMPSKNTFLSIVKNGIWVHNDICNSYCNFYGVDYPFEVEYMVDTKTQVTSLRSLEYLLEVYKYAENCYDRFHVLDFNFDEAVIYNSEQVSGLLRLNLTPKNRPWQSLNFPRVVGNLIDVLFDKVEQKYRINQFWDITSDRGEFNVNAERVIWNTQANGYVKVLNQQNMNYNKNSLERKKFRHYINNVFFRRRVSGDKKMLVILDSNKVLISQR